MASKGRSILLLDPKQEVTFLVKGKRINDLSQGQTSRNTHRMQKVRQSHSGRETGAPIHSKEITFCYSYWRTNQKCYVTGIFGPKEVLLNISRLEIWGQNPNRNHRAHKMWEETNYSPNATVFCILVLQNNSRTLSYIVFSLLHIKCL